MALMIGSVAGRRLRALLATLCLFTLAFAASAYGDGRLPPEFGGPDGRLPKPTPAFEKALAKRIEAARRAEQAFQVKLKTPAERRKRVQSRTAYRGMSGPDAMSLVNRVHPQVAKTAAPMTARATAGDRVLEYPSENSAIVDPAGPGIARELRLSDLPLRVEDGDGTKRPVDLTLVDRGDDFAPTAALGDFAVSKQSSVGLSLTDGYRLAPAGNDVSGTLDGNSVFYANVDTDTDWVVSPKAAGVETHYILRSQDSPEVMRLHVGLQPGAQLELGDQGDVSVVMNGEKVGYLTPTYTWDANHQAVDTQVSVDGSDIVLTVPHHGKDVAYPLEVDPTTSAMFWFSGFDDRVWSYFGWWDVTAGGEVNPITTTGYYRPSGQTGYLGRGLYINVPDPKPFHFNGSFGASEKSFWFFRSPGASSITDVYTYIFNDVPGSGQLCTFWGIAGAGLSPFEGGSNGVRCDRNSDDPLISNPSPSPGNVWMFGLYPASDGAFVGTAYESFISMGLLDNDVPTVGTWGGDSDLQGGVAFIRRDTDTISLQATDPSLGIKTLRFTGADPTAGGTTITFKCPAGPCPRSIPANGVPDPVTGQEQPPNSVMASTFLNGQPMPDGRRIVTGTVTDAVGHNASSSTPFVFDLNPPVITLSGDLYETRGELLDPARDLYTLHVHADDAGSGARLVRIFVDGQQVFTNAGSGSCPVGSDGGVGGSCDVDFPFDPGIYSDEPHTIRVEADDNNPYNALASTQFTINDELPDEPDFTLLDDGVCTDADCGQELPAEDPGDGTFLMSASATTADESCTALPAPTMLNYAHLEFTCLHLIQDAGHVHMEGAIIYHDGMGYMCQFAAPTGVIDGTSSATFVTPAGWALNPSFRVDFAGPHDTTPDLQAQSFILQSPTGGFVIFDNTGAQVIQFGSVSPLCPTGSPLSTPPLVGTADTRGDIANSNATPAELGIADNIKHYFNDAGEEAGENIFDSSTGLRSLNLTWARRTVSWNIANYPNSPEHRALERWLDESHDAQLKPMISFDVCHEDPNEQGPPAGSCKGKSNLPTVAAYDAAVRAFHTQFPQVHKFTAWNEPNNGYQSRVSAKGPFVDIAAPDTLTEPTAFAAADGAPLNHDTSGAWTAGQYWQKLHIMCSTPPNKCTAAAGEFIDTQVSNDSRLVDDRHKFNRYLAQYRAGMGKYRPNVEAWAWHAYTDMKRRANARTRSGAWSILRRFMRATAVQGKNIWLTEQGSLFRRDNQPTGLSAATAAMNVRCLLKDAAGYSTRVKKIFYYQWKGEPKWDSGLKTPGQPWTGWNGYNEILNRNQTGSCPTPPNP
jgi:hypothetical protein